MSNRTMPAPDWETQEMTPDYSFQQRLQTSLAALTRLRQQMTRLPGGPPPGVAETLAELAYSLDELRAAGQAMQERALHEALDQHERIEAALTEERNMLRTLIDNLPDFVYFKDTLSRFVTGNETVARVMGAGTVEGLIGKTDFDFYPVELAAHYYADEQDILQTGRPFINQEEPIIDAQGNRRWVLTTKMPLRDQQQRIVGLVGVGRDITELRQAEASLRESQARLEAIIGAATDAIITIDAEQRIILFNAAAERMFGYQAGQVMGQPLDMLLPERYRAAHGEYIRRFGRTGVTARSMGRSSELHARRASGQEFMIEAMISQVEVARQKLYTVILRDVTERNWAEREKAMLFEAVSRQREQLRALTGRLAEAREVERKELARELHDQVGQQLTALNLSLKVIQTQLPAELNGGPVGRSLHDSLALVEQTTESIQDLMANLRPPLLDDYGLAAALRWYCRQFAQRVSFSIGVQGEEPTPRLPAPVEHALFRITQEALTNAAKHAQASRVVVMINSDAEQVWLTITDNGVGFETGERGRPDGRQSWGLLTMVERAEAVGGHCQINSRPGSGTQVIVEAPR
jgi:PAS domain S-box-containing protein